MTTVFRKGIKGVKIYIAGLPTPLNNTAGIAMDHPRRRQHGETMLTQDHQEMTGIRVTMSGEWVIGDPCGLQEVIEGASLTIFILLKLNAGTTQMIVDDTGVFVTMTSLPEGTIVVEAIVRGIEAM